MKLKGNFIHREIAGEHMLVPIGNENMCRNGLFVLTEVAARILELLPECETQSQIADKILDEYDVDRETAEADVAELMASLKELQLLE